MTDNNDQAKPQGTLPAFVTGKPAAPLDRNAWRAAMAKVEENAHQADQAGKIVVDSRADGVLDMLLRRARHDGDAQRQLKTLQAAEDVLRSGDPFAVRAALGAFIVEWAQSDRPISGDDLIPLIFDAAKNRDGALPLLEQGRTGGRQFEYPRLDISHSGTMRTVGRIRVGADNQSQEVIKAFEELRNRAAADAFERLNNKCLVRLRQLVKSLLFTVPGSVMENPRRAGELSRSTDWKGFRLSEQEIFFVPARRNDAETIIELLEQSKAMMAEFWQGKLNVVDYFNERRSYEGSPEWIEGDAFLLGTPGMAFVKHSSWRENSRPQDRPHQGQKRRGHEGATVETMLILERCEKRGWRIAMANLAAADMLLRGSNLDFCTWSREALPPRIIANVKGGKDVNLDEYSTTSTSA